MDSRSLLLDAFGRIPAIAHGAVEGLSMDQLLTPPTPGSNPIGWLIWHIARVEDCQIAPLAGLEQLWVIDDWGPRFGLASDPANLGYGHTPEQVAAVKPASAEALLDYLGAAQARALSFLSTVDDAALDRIVDERFTPHVTLGVRLISIVADCLEHGGQASYLRGMLRQ